MPTGTPSQTTAYVCGVSPSTGSAISSNYLLYKTEYPNATTGAASTAASDDVTDSYDALGEETSTTDQNGTTHTFGIDPLGRDVADAVTLPSGNPEHIDTTVMLHTTSYNNQGNPSLMTSFSAVTGGTIVNQDEDVYNGLGQLTGEFQSASGAVVVGTTPEVQYAYSDASVGSLMTSMTYPNGRILDYGYNNNALDAAVGRVDYLADGNGSDAGDHDVDYSYMGDSTIVQQAFGNGNILSYIQQSGDSSAITTGPQYAGDDVTGLDRFDRIIDQNYVNESTGTSTDRFQYGYDQDSNVLYSDNLVNSSESELFHTSSTTSGDDNSAYDPLSRLDAFARGTLSASGNNGSTLDTVTSASETQSWTLDAVGNQTSVTTNGTTVSNTSNAKNELTANGSAGLTFDNDGNTIVDENGNVFTFDAWNHIATDKTSTGTLINAYTYDAEQRRITEADSSGGSTGSPTATTLLYNGQQIIEQRQGATVTSQNVWSIDYVNDLLLRDDNSTTGSLGASGSGLGERLYYQHDANFDTTALTNTSGAVVERFVYSPYGSVTVLSPSWGTTTDAYSTNKLFQGMWLDLTTGLYYTPNRDYGPATGTWREADPGGYMEGADAYEMEGASPTRFVDPFGLSAAPPTVDQLQHPEACQLLAEAQQCQQIAQSYSDILWNEIHQLYGQSLKGGLLSPDEAGSEQQTWWRLSQKWGERVEFLGTDNERFKAYLNKDQTVKYGHPGERTFISDGTTSDPFVYKVPYKLQRPLGATILDALSAAVIGKGGAATEGQELDDAGDDSGYTPVGRARPGTSRQPIDPGAAKNEGAEVRSEAGVAAVQSVASAGNEVLNGSTVTAIAWKWSDNPKCNGVYVERVADDVGRNVIKQWLGVNVDNR